MLASHIGHQKAAPYIASRRTILRRIYYTVATSSPDRSSTPDDIRQYARKQLLNHVRSAKISLAKAAMFISLEETAASKRFCEDASLLQLWAEDIAVRSTFTRAVGVESTWSLERFESLADEVTNLLYKQTQQDGGHASQKSSKGDNVPRLLTRPVRPLTERGNLSLPPWSAAQLSSGATEAAAAAVAAARKTALEKLQAQIAAEGHVKSQALEPKAPSTTQSALERGFPFAITSALSSVLYKRHGYQRMSHHGNPLSSQLNAVMEDGAGTPILMAILYQEVASRAGLPLDFLLLDDSQYCLLWPQRDGCDPSLFIDPYHNGDLLASEEVRELFQLARDNRAAFRPATVHELLDALLSSLQAAHWSAAAGCSPEPALRTPLMPATALVRGKRHLSPFSMERAIAAAERRLVVLPCWSTQLELAVLLHLASEYERAWLELALCVETLPDDIKDTTTAKQLAILVEKTRLQLEMTA